jgi:predicted protein tyrosine phosphatase
MPDFDLGKICFVVVRARELNVTEELDESDVDASNMTDELVPAAMLTSGNDDETAQEIRDFVGAMNEDEQLALVALCWIGRGDFDAEQWDEAVALARDRREKPTADYLMTMPLLSDYLEEGLAAFGLTCTQEEADRL